LVWIYLYILTAVWMEPAAKWCWWVCLLILNVMCINCWVSWFS